ncbi:alkaline phosphatase family protein [Undibacterium parvum]|uniref:Phosphoesterase n=2 Tax=Undibacterium TaxID=401469 RepID=A0A6M4A4C4_9BURK|nr:alkaline phosphatase family protein [Undibacterium parvum]AZP11804.1 hypothetical protein EJN92_07210 [Undibacterium parvum]QJQ06222.1 hypothetical protein EJG51_010535 [Undibacterium piscinae]
MLISIINRSKKITDEQVQNAIRAINRQVKEDFEPYWSFGATLRLEGRIGKSVNKNALPELRGDAILYLSDKADVEDALGYHDKNFRGIPYGFVFTELCEQLKESWTVTLSHEAMELIGDAQANLLVQGPHPSIPGKEVFHWFEMCDAVQSDTYAIDDVEVSNFVLPLYFTTEEQEGGRNDFLGRLTKGKALNSFGVNPGGYVGYYDPQSRTHETYAAPDDKKAQQRIAIKGKVKFGRSYVRKRADATIVKEQEHKRILGANPTISVATHPDPIRHVIVLMLENRSFDHMLGDASKIYPDLEGIPQHGPRYQNTSSASKISYAQKPNAMNKIAIDMPHEYVDVMAQMGSSTVPPMGGFVDAYLSVAGVKESNPGQVEQVMSYFPLGATAAKDSLPALHGLARNFLVCDHWFSSMPGPTWPNRFFVHSGTCLGRVLMPSRQHPANLFGNNQDTIYNRLDDADKTWRIYHQGVPQSIVMTKLLPKLFTSHYSGMKNFYTDVAGPESDFPDYVFIEPAYFGADENDQHPPSDVALGEQLIANVYQALRANQELWESTLLIVTYDEHGGFFDHVPPPLTVAPDSNTKEFAFNRLGVRVPAILVSPWVDAGVCKTQFEHSSILRYLCDKWAMPPLSARTSSAAGVYQSKSLLPELSKRSTPRTDTPLKLAANAVTALKKAGAGATPESPVDGSREALMYFVANLPEDLKAKPAARKASAPSSAKLKQISDTQLRKLAEQKFASLMAGKARPVSTKKKTAPK